MQVRVPEKMTLMEKLNILLPFFEKYVKQCL